jgi:hypothetical protein
MCHEHLALSLIELMQSGKTPSSADPVLHHAPEAFNRVEVMAAAGGQQMEVKLAIIVCQRGGEFPRTMDATTIDDHHDLLVGFAKDAHDLMDILAEFLSIKMGHDLIKDA